MNANDLNRLVAAVTDVTYQVAGVLNSNLDACTITEEQANDLRIALTYLSNANSCLYHLGRELVEGVAS